MQERYDIHTDPSTAVKTELGVFIVQECSSLIKQVREAIHLEVRAGDYERCGLVLSLL